MKTTSVLTSKPSDFLGTIFGYIEEYFSSLASGIISENSDHIDTLLLKQMTLIIKVEVLQKYMRKFVSIISIRKSRKGELKNHCLSSSI